LEYAKEHWRKRFDGMAHFAHQAALQADQVTRHEIVENLAAAVGQELVAKRAPRKDRIQMRVVAAFDNHRRATIDIQLAGLEPADKGQFLFLKRSEDFQRPQRALFARIPLCRQTACPDQESLLAFTDARAMQPGGVQ